MTDNQWRMVESSVSRSAVPAWNDEAKQTLIAFANTFGGRLFVGLEADGKACGSGDADALRERVLDFCRREAEPDLSPLVRVSLQVVDGKDMGVISVAPGSDRPYALRGRDWLSGGVWVRLGAVTAAANRADILRMAQDVVPWEERICCCQTLTFAEASALLGKEAAVLSEAGLADEAGRFTELGLLLSDQNPHGVTVSRFDGENGLQETRTFTGSLLRQRAEIWEWLRVLSSEAGREVWTPRALQEALAHSLVQRDFSAEGEVPTTISVFRDRMVFQASSSLPFDVTAEDVFENGFAFCRNPRLATVFKRLGWMSSAAGSFSAIWADYSKSLRKPVVSTTGRLFRLTLPRRAFPEETLGDRLVSMLRTTPGLGRKALEKAVGMSRASVTTELRRLLEEGRLERRGAARATRYYLRPGA